MTFRLTPGERNNIQLSEKNGGQGGCASGLENQSATLSNLGFATFEKSGEFSPSPNREEVLR